MPTTVNIYRFLALTVLLLLVVGVGAHYTGLVRTAEHFNQQFRRLDPLSLKVDSPGDLAKLNEIRNHIFAEAHAAGFFARLAVSWGGFLLLLQLWFSWVQNQTSAYSFLSINNLLPTWLAGPVRALLPPKKEEMKAGVGGDG